MFNSMWKKAAHPLVAVIAMITLAITACGGGGSAVQQQPSISISPTSAQVDAGAKQSFTASVQNCSVTTGWSVSASGGTIDQAGNYTAPASAPSGGKATITASACSVSASATVTVMNASITAGKMPGPVMLNSSGVKLPVTCQNCAGMTYTVTPDFPVTPSGYTPSIVVATVTFGSASSGYQPTFTPGSSMPYIGQYTFTFTAAGTNVQTVLTVDLTTPAPQMDPNNPVTPATLPAGDGSATLTFNGIKSTFVSNNDEGIFGSAPNWPGTMEASDPVGNGAISMTYIDTNHVAIGVAYGGATPETFALYLINPTPGGGVSVPIYISYVATSTSSSVFAGSTVAQLSSKLSESAGVDGKVQINSENATIKFSDATTGATLAEVPALGMHQIFECGSSGTPAVCGVSDSVLSVYNFAGRKVGEYLLPEKMKFGLADKQGWIFLFSANGKVWQQQGATFTVIDGFPSGLSPIAAATSNNQLAILFGDDSGRGSLVWFDTSSGKRVATIDVAGASEYNNISLAQDGTAVVAKHGSANALALNPNWGTRALTLPRPLLTLNNAAASLDDGSIVSIDAATATTTPIARAASPTDLYSGFRVNGTGVQVIRAGKAAVLPLLNAPAQR